MSPTLRTQTTNALPSPQKIMAVAETIAKSDDQSQATEPGGLVFRLSWVSLTNTLVSGALLRDYFLTNTLPPTHIEIEIPVLSSFVAVTLLTPSSHSHTTISTNVYLLPPIPPSLCTPSLLPISKSTFRDPAVLSLLTLSLDPHSLLENLSLPPPRTFLIHAPRGAGLTSTLAAAANQNHATFLHLPAAHLLRHQTSPQSLHQLLLHYLSAARLASPAIIALDDAALLFPRESDTHLLSFIRFVRTLTTYSSSDRVAIVVCATPGAHAIHPSVVEACDLVLPLAIDPCGEWALASAARKTGVPLEVVRPRVAAHTVTTISDTIDRAIIPFDASSSPRKEDSDLHKRWEHVSRNIGGLSEPLKILQRMLLYPKIKQESLRHFKVSPAKGLLLHGPPGTGKTYAVREAAYATNYPVIPVDAATLARGEVGASERLLTQVFNQAEGVAPCIVFFDEIDALFATSALSRLVAVLALRMDSVSRVTVIAATNKPEVVSKALLRPGRFEHVVKVPLPDAAERREIAKTYANKMELSLEGEAHLCRLASDADGFSGADIAGVCRRASMSALCRDAEIQTEDLSDAFAAVRPISRILNCSTK